MWIFDIAFNDAIHSNWYNDGPNKENDFLQICKYTNHAIMYFWNWFGTIQLIFREIYWDKCLFAASIGKYFYTFGESFLQVPAVSIHGAIDGLFNAAFFSEVGGSYCVKLFGRVRHIFVGNLTIIGSDNGLSPGMRHAIIWPSAGILWAASLARICVAQRQYLVNIGDKTTDWPSF